MSDGDQKKLKHDPLEDVSEDAMGNTSSIPSIWPIAKSSVASVPALGSEMESEAGELAASAAGSALEKLVKGNMGWLRGWFRGRVRDPEIVDDLTQETFLRALRGFSRLRDPARFSAWLYRTAENLLRDHFRRKGRRGDTVVFTAELDGADSGLSAEEQLTQTEDVERLLRQVEQLPARYREPLLLRHAQDLSYTEISELLGVTENTVRVRIFRARQMLRKKAGKDHE